MLCPSPSRFFKIATQKAGRGSGIGGWLRAGTVEYRDDPFFGLGIEGAEWSWEHALEEPQIPSGGIQATEKRPKTGCASEATELGLKSFHAAVILGN